MADVRSVYGRVARRAIVGIAICLVGWCDYAAAQEALPSNTIPAPAATTSAEEIVVDVRVDGNQAVPLHRIAPHIQTRAGRAFSPDIVEEDVRRLTRSRMFVNVNTTYQRVPEGVVVVFQVVERPTLTHVKYLGATLKRSTIDKQTNLKVGDSIDPHMIDEARRKLEEYYKSKGFSKARVVTLEGNKPGDRGAVFKVTEGPKLKIYDIEFEGNTIADDGRLKTQISSRPPILYLFKGEIDYEKIDEDVNKLTSYYRGLGFFGAKIGREIEFDEGSRWATLRFVINEGPRYKVRNVSILGNKQFETVILDEKLKLKNGLYFDQGMMVKDISSLQDHYGAIGYVFCNVQADPRFLEEPGELDLVYQIEEGDRYRVGRVNVRIEGDDPHTRINTVLNRVELRPGDIVDIRKIRDSERRLKASGLFKNDPATGEAPKITWEVPENDDILTAEKSGNSVRGQSPDNAAPVQTAPVRPLVHSLPPTETHGEKVLDVTIDGELTPAESQTPVYQRGPLPFTGPGEDAKPAEATRPPLFAPLNQQSLDGNPYWTGRRRYAVEQPAEAVSVAQVGAHGFAAAHQRAVEPGTSPFDVVAQNALANDGLVVRGQSPLQAPTYGQPSYGQVPLGSTSPQGTATSSYPPPGTIPTQYTTPNPGYSSAPVSPAVPSYGTPTYSYPGNTTPPQNYGQTGPLAPVTQPQVVQGTPYMPPVIGAQPAPGYGSGNDLFGGSPNPVFDPDGPVTRDLTIIPQVAEAQTGRFMLGVGVNSNAGVLGSIVLDEQNADITRLPTSWRDFIEGRAFRGAGQQVRIEAVPGSQVSRYTFLFRQPYLFDTRVSLSASAYYFQRYYRDWLEERLGGRVGFGYQFPYVPDLSVTTAIRMEQVGIEQPTVPTPPQLASALGDSNLFVWENQIVHDTRDSTFIATEGHRIALGFDMGFGTYSFPRGTIDARQHFLLGERPDGSGRQVLTLQTQLGFTGSDTPIFENYFAGGFSSMRGFNFRGVGPVVQQVNVGGQFQWLNTVEYMFSVTADDMVRGVVFCDFGTVEESIELQAENFRVAPGFGLRITVPALGPAPIALDFAVPVAHAPGDNIQNFAFYFGFGR
jgi:outer membrane protein insertion porin family